MIFVFTDLLYRLQGVGQLKVRELAVGRQAGSSALLWLCSRHPQRYGDSVFSSWCTSDSPTGTRWSLPQRPAPP